MSRENAIKVLKEVQTARDTLENNILEVCRKHEQVDLFSYFDERARHGEEENDVIRIKKQVNDKIKEISNEIQDEIYTKKTCNNKGEKGLVGRKRERFPLRLLNKNSTLTSLPTNINSKLPVKPSKQKVKRGKIKESKKSESPPKSSTAYDELILQHIYGRQPHQSHRHTFRNEKPGFCSSHKHNLSQTVQIPYPTAVMESKQLTKDVNIQPKNEYCIHLQPHNIPFSITDNFPTAIPLVEPSRSLSERLPLSIIPNEITETESPKVVVKKHQLSKAGPNVAVINIKSDDTAEYSAIKNRIRSKVRERLRNKMKLNIQPLPNVDIDTTDPSSSSVTSSTTQISINDTGLTNQTKNQSINESIKHASEVNNENPYDFEDFISVQDIPNESRNDTEDEVQPESFKQPEISLPGCKITHEQDYHGPVFPPQQFQKMDDPIHAIPVEMSPTLEQSAKDWLEKELLARLITQMIDQQNQLPTTEEFAGNVSMVSVEPDESKSSHEWVDNIIGLQGIQLFVDAGLPVNNNLITELVRNIILEYLETLFGHPQPERVPEPPTETHVQTDIPTPLSTPVTTPRVSEKKESPVTPDQTISDLTEQNINDIVNDSVSVAENCDELCYETIKTPEISILEHESNVLNNNIVTPDITLIDDVDVDDDCNGFHTPLNSDKTVELAQIPMTDFEITDKVVSPQSTFHDDKKLSDKELEITPPPVVVVAKPLSVTSSPSIPSTTYTTSSSSAMGLSNFDEISMGEYLNADSAVSDASEGELRFGGRLKSWKQSEDNIVDDTFSKSASQRYLFPSKAPRSFEKPTHRNNDILSEGEISQSFFRPLKSIGEISDIKTDQSNIDSEDLDDDADELSIAKELVDHNDPMVRLLHKIKSPPGHLSYPGISDKSEGEIVHQQIKYSVQKFCLSSGENISKASLTLGMLNEESDLVSSIKDDSNLSPVPVTSGHVITVRPVSQNDSKSDDIKEILRSDGEVLNYENSLQGEIHRSDGEFLNLDLDIQEVINCDVDSDESVVDKDDKVVMVLRLPEVEDDHNVTDDDLSPGDISTISEF